MGLRGKLGKNSFSEAFADIVCIFGIVQNFSQLFSYFFNRSCFNEKSIVFVFCKFYNSSFIWRYGRSQK